MTNDKRTGTLVLPALGQNGYATKNNDLSSSGDNFKQMRNLQENQKSSKSEDNGYEKPAIIYDSVITTRAGSPILDESPTPPDERPVIDLFPSD